MRPPGLFVGAAFSIKFGYSERRKKERGCGPTERKMSWCGFVFLGTSLWSVCVLLSSFGSILKLSGLKASAVCSMYKHTVEAHKHSHFSQPNLLPSSPRPPPKKGGLEPYIIDTLLAVSTGWIFSSPPPLLVDSLTPLFLCSRSLHCLHIPLWLLPPVPA